MHNCSIKVVYFLCPYCIFSCSLYAYFEVWTSRMQDADPTSCEYPSYNQLRYTWYSYLKLLDLDYSSSCCCPELVVLLKQLCVMPLLCLFGEKWCFVTTLLQLTQLLKPQSKEDKYFIIELYQG